MNYLLSMKQMLKGETSTYVFVIGTKVYIYIRCIHTQGEREGETSYLCLRSAFERTGEPVSI